MIKEINRIENKLLKDRYSNLSDTISATIREHECNRPVAKRYLVAMCIKELTCDTVFDSEEKEQFAGHP